MSFVECYKPKSGDESKSIEIQENPLQEKLPGKAIEQDNIPKEQSRGDDEEEEDDFRNGKMSTVPYAPKLAV